jgi:hypothetical protein
MILTPQMEYDLAKKLRNLIRTYSREHVEAVLQKVTNGR